MAPALCDIDTDLKRAAVFGKQNGYRLAYSPIPAGCIAEWITRITAAS